MVAVNTIPNELYRGDADQKGIRKLKTTVDHFQFQTNLISGGQGRKIFEEPIKKLINQHVGIGWANTHFLSFTEDLLTAYRYGANDMELLHDDIDTHFIDYYDTDSHWDFGLLTLQSKKIHWKELDTGLFEGFFPASLLKFSKVQNEYRVLLMHVETVLTSAGDPVYKTALKNSAADKEWLVLQATTVTLNAGRHEYSAILDGACIDFRKIKRL